MDMQRHLAFLPVMNLGHKDVADHFFACGAKLQNGVPHQLNSAIAKVLTSDYVSPNEARAFQLAKAWLWIGSDEIPADMNSQRNAIAICSELAETIWMLRWFIDLAGAGENDYWRTDSNAHCAGPYVFTQDVPIYPPHRKHFIFSPPSYTQRVASWSEERMMAADQLQQNCERCRGAIIPRVGLANRLAMTRTMYDARQVAVRFALAFTAMETLFVAPPERLDLWCPKVKARITEVCTGVDNLDDEFFTNLQDMRNDAVHRGGRDRQGNPIRFINVHAQFEEVVRASLRWALLSLPDLAEAFKCDDWPAPQPNTLERCLSLNRSLYVHPANS